VEGRILLGGSEGELRLTSAADTITIEAHGTLDAATVAAMAGAAAGALENGWDRVHIDLGHITGHTDDGLDALADLQGRYPPGAGRRIAYRASSDTGQEALLAAYSRAG
jgi:hypothetical protein